MNIVVEFFIQLCTASLFFFQDYQIGAPVLIDLDHGSIRYRYMQDSKGNSVKKEKPFEGDPTQKKGHYFYHPRLNDFSSSMCFSQNGALINP
jgi:hypothetical protein